MPLSWGFWVKVINQEDRRMASKEYSRGYNAGRSHNDKQLQMLAVELATLQKSRETKKERIFMRSLEIVLEHCDGWSVGKKKINDAKGYCKLAEIFADNAIDIIE